MFNSISFFSEHTQLLSNHHFLPPLFLMPPVTMGPFLPALTAPSFIAAASALKKDNYFTLFETDIKVQLSGVVQKWRKNVTHFDFTDFLRTLGRQKNHLLSVILGQKWSQFLLWQTHKVHSRAN
jgi:hypothetical protein